MGDSCGNKRFSIILPTTTTLRENDDVFVIDISSVGERVCVRGEKTLVGPDDRQAGRGFHAVVNRLALEIETLEADLARVSLHQLVIPQRLAIGDIAPVLILLLACRPPALTLAGYLANWKISSRES